MADPGDDYMTASEAQAFLGVSNRKMADLLKTGRDGEPPALASIPDPLDRRYKLVKRSDVEALGRQSKKLAA